MPVLLGRMRPCRENADIRKRENDSPKNASRQLTRCAEELSESFAQGPVSARKRRLLTLT